MRRRGDFRDGRVDRHLRRSGTQRSDANTNRLSFRGWRGGLIGIETRLKSGTAIIQMVGLGLDAIKEEKFKKKTDHQIVRGKFREKRRGDVEGTIGPGIRGPPGVTNGLQTLKQEKPIDLTGKGTGRGKGESSRNLNQKYAYSVIMPGAWEGQQNTYHSWTLIGMRHRIWKMARGRTLILVENYFNGKQAEGKLIRDRNQRENARKDNEGGKGVGNAEKEGEVSKRGGNTSITTRKGKHSKVYVGVLKAKQMRFP